MMILVGPTEVQVYPDCLTIAAATDTITWNPTNSSSSTLFIEFDEKLFTNMSQVMTNKRWRVTHSGSTSYSGHVLKTYPQNTKIEYKYHQILNGKDYDGRIIIKW